MQISHRPAMVVRPASRPVAVKAAAPVEAASAPKPAARPVVKPTAVAKPAAMSTGQMVGAVGGGAAGATVGYLFGSVLASGGLSGLLPFALGLGGLALMGRGGMVIADAIAGKTKAPTLAQGIVGAGAGLVTGGAVWALTAFAGGMAMIPWVFVAAIPMGIATAVLGGAAIGSFVPGRK